jgi:hypothetical protein
MLKLAILVLFQAVQLQTRCGPTQVVDATNGSCICPPSQKSEPDGSCKPSNTSFSRGPSLRLGDIRDALFKGNYDKYSRPGYGSNDPTAVQCQFKINQVSKVDPIRSEFTLDLFVRLRWNDSRLKYASDIGTETLQIDNHNVLWKPDVYFEKFKQLIYSEAEKMVELDGTVKIDGLGTVFWSRHLIMTLVTSFRMHDFPFDSQVLDVKLISFANNDEILTLSYFPEGPVFPPVETTFSSVLWMLDGSSYSSHKIINRIGKPAFDLLTVFSI